MEAPHMNTPGLGSPVDLRALTDGDPEGPAPPLFCGLGSPSLHPGPPGPWWLFWSRALTQDGLSPGDTWRRF